MVIWTTLKRKEKVDTAGTNLNTYYTERLVLASLCFLKFESNVYLYLKNNSKAFFNNH